MAIKVYVSGISGNKEVKKRQQRVLMILDSKNIKYEVVDIAEPGNEEAKEFMQSNSKYLGATIGDANPKYPLPPQLFNDEKYCGDYDQFDMSNEIDEIEKFLKLPYDDSVTSTAQVKIGNGEIHPETVTNGNEAEATDKSDDNAASDKLVDVDDDQVTSSVNENELKQDENDTENKEEKLKPQEENEAEEKMESQDDETKDASKTIEENEDVSKEEGDGVTTTKLDAEADSKEKNDSDESDEDSETKVEKEEKEDA